MILLHLASCRALHCVRIGVLNVAISELLFISASLDLHKNRNSSLFQWLCTRTRFETEAWSNSEISYFIIWQIQSWANPIALIGSFSVGILQYGPFPWKRSKPCIFVLEQNRQIHNLQPKLRKKTVNIVILHSETTRRS